MVFNSEFTKRVWEEIYPSPSSHEYVIYPPSKFTFENRVVEHQERGAATAGARPYFVMVGGQRQRKDPLAIIREWSRTSSHTDFDLVVVGRIDPSLLTPIELELQERGHLRFLSGISDSELSALIGSSRGLVFYSHGEGFGMPLAEALSLGVPVICNDLDVFREVVGGEGALFQTGHPEQAIPLLLRLARHKVRIPVCSRYSAEEAMLSWGRIFESHITGERP